MYFEPKYEFTLQHPYFVDTAGGGSAFDTRYFRFVAFKGWTEIHNGFNLKVVVNFNYGAAASNGDRVYRLFGSNINTMMDFLISNDIKCALKLSGTHDNIVPGRNIEFSNTFSGKIASFRVLFWKTQEESMDLELEMVPMWSKLANNSSFFVYAKDSYQTYENSSTTYDSALAGTKGITIKEIFGHVLSDNNMVGDVDYSIDFSDTMTMNGGTVVSAFKAVSPLVPVSTPIFSTLENSDGYLISKKRFILQYHESDLDFLKRLSESEGISLLDSYEEYVLSMNGQRVEVIDGVSYIVVSAIGTSVTSSTLTVQQAKADAVESIYQQLANLATSLFSQQLDMADVFAEVESTKGDMRKLSELLRSTNPASKAGGEVAALVDLVEERGVLEVLTMGFSEVYSLLTSGEDSEDGNRRQEKRDARQDSRTPEASLDISVDMNRLLTNISLNMYRKAIKRLFANTYEPLFVSLFTDVPEQLALSATFYYPMYENDPSPADWLFRVSGVRTSVNKLILTDKPNFPVRNLSPSTVVPFSDLSTSQDFEGAQSMSVGSDFSDMDDIVGTSSEQTAQKESNSTTIDATSSTTYTEMSMLLGTRSYQSSIIDTYANVTINYPLTYRPKIIDSSNATLRDLSACDENFSSNHAQMVVLANTNEYSGAISSTFDYQPLTASAYIIEDSVSGGTKFELGGTNLQAGAGKSYQYYFNESIDTLEEANRKAVRRLEALQSSVNISKFEGYIIDVMSGAQCFLYDYRKIVGKLDAYYVVRAELEGYDRAMMGNYAPYTLPFRAKMELLNIGDNRNLVYRPLAETPVPKIEGVLRGRIAGSEVVNEEFLNYKSESLNSDTYIKDGVKTKATETPRIDSYGRQFLKLDHTSFRNFNKTGSLTVPMSTKRFYADGLGKGGFSYPFADNTEVFIGFQDGSPYRPFIAGAVNPYDYDSNLLKNISKGKSYFKLSRGSSLSFSNEAGRERMVLENDTRIISGDLTRAGSVTFPDDVYYPPLGTMFLDVADPVDLGITYSDEHLEAVLPSSITFAMPNFIEVKDESNISRATSYIDIGFARAYSDETPVIVEEVIEPEASEESEDTGNVEG